MWGEELGRGRGREMGRAGVGKSSVFLPGGLPGGLPRGPSVFHVGPSPGLFPSFRGFLINFYAVW